MNIFSYLKDTQEKGLPLVENNTMDAIGDAVDKKGKSDSEYFDMVDEETGYKYDIPLLDTAAPNYYYKYVYYMKLRESSPTTFESIMNWD